MSHYDVRDLAPTFDTPYDGDQRAYIGQPFQLVQMWEEEHVTNYRIRFPDGFEYDAWEEEIFPGSVPGPDGEVWVHRDQQRAEAAVQQTAGAWWVEHESVSRNFASFDRKAVAMWVYLQLEHSKQMREGAYEQPEEK